MKTYGILPMAGKGSRIQPIGFSKELYPFIFKGKHYAISEYSLLGMQRAGVDEIKLVINPDKFDIAKYYSKKKSIFTSVYFYNSSSLPESCLYPIDGMHDDDICLFGLPDTLFSPNTAYTQVKNQLLKGADLCLGLFEVEDGSYYDSVLLKDDKVIDVLVKQNPPLSNWIWGIWGANVKTLKILKKEIDKQVPPTGEKLLGVGFARLAKNKKIKMKGIKISNQYFDVGTMDAILNINKYVRRFEI